MAHTDYGFSAKVEEGGEVYNPQTGEIPQDYTANPLGAARAQLHETYIVAQTRDGIVIVDQHAAHERLVYERMKEAMKGQGVERQALLIPDIVDLGETDAARVLARAEELAEMGLVVEAFGTGAVARPFGSLFATRACSGASCVSQHQSEGTREKQERGEME